MSVSPAERCLLHQVDGPAAALATGLGMHYLLRFLAIALPGGVLMAADAASFDITTAFAGFLGLAPVPDLLQLLRVFSQLSYVALCSAPCSCSCLLISRL